jgi:hypothetical protein
MQVRTAFTGFSDTPKGWSVSIYITNATYAQLSTTTAIWMTMKSNMEADFCERARTMLCARTAV